MRKYNCSVKGCDNLEIARTWCHKHYKRWQVHGDANATPGYKYHGKDIDMSLYMTWIGMRERCSKVKSDNYHRYGARGIKVCSRWQKSYINFINDVGSRPSPQHTLDRINNNGNYEPSNFRWSLPYRQNRNTSRNKKLTYNNKTMVAADWAREIGIPLSTIYGRIRRGWAVENILSTNKNVEYKRREKRYGLR